MCVFSIPDYFIKLNAFQTQRQIAVEKLLLIAEQIELEEKRQAFRGGTVP